jgi:hypothetical protein
MTGKQYGTLEKLAIGVVFTLVGAFVAVVLLGVYALATLVS